jgi:transposase
VVGLLEYELQEDVADEEWAAVVEDAKRSLRSSFDSDKLRFARDVLDGDIVCVEGSGTYKAAPGSQVRAAVDVTYRSGDFLVVLD